MGMWLITDPRADRIYGTVEADNETVAAGLVDLGRARWFWRSEPGPHRQLAVHDVIALAGDGKWRELGVATPGGDVLPEQVGDSVQRRYGMPLTDGSWAIYTATWFVADYGDERRNAVRLERQEEYLISTDVHQPGDTYTFEDMRYLIEEGWAAEPASPPYAADDFDSAAEIAWNGKEFR